jgi:lysophospholipase L1-like esterase
VTSSEPSSNSDELERLVQFCHPRKILAGTRLPGRLDDASLARLYASSIEEPRALRAAFDARAAEAARRLLQDDAVHSAALSLGTGTVLALGDSITDDAQSWAEILRHVLRSVRPGARVVNAGLSGDSTTNAIARLHHLACDPPDCVLVLLGTNDARRHRGGPVLVSSRETARNLVSLHRALATMGRPRVAWIVPPPVLEDCIAADPVLREAELSWRAADVAAKAALVRRMPGLVVDTWPTFGVPPSRELLLPDGLHPSLAGQARIAAAVIETLARS